MNNSDEEEVSLGKRINDRLLTLPKTPTLIAFIATVSILTTLSVIFILNQPWHNLTVGSITTPSPVQKLNEEIVTDRSTRSLEQRRRDEAFLDSVETFGVDGMRDIYFNQLNSNNDGNQ